MPELASQRCLNHSTREAVARCPECGRYFCRECITEHEERILCAACLAKLARVPLSQKPAFQNFARVAQSALGILLAWFFFFLIGEALLKIPTTFHEGTLWRVKWMDKP